MVPLGIAITAAAGTGVVATAVATSINTGPAVVHKIKKRISAKGTQPTTGSARRRNVAANTQFSTATNTQPSTATIRRRNTTENRKCYSFESGGLVCDMECMIIASFGETPTGVTAVPKVPSKGGSFLPGVREDLMNVQTLIKNDPHKTLAYTFMDFPGEECLRPREEYLQHIEVFLQGCKTPGGELSFHGSFCV